MKKIWIFTVGEPPLFDESQRKHRSGILAEYLSKNFNVVFWSSNFFHQNKLKFKAKDYLIKNNLVFRAIDTLGYKKNVSIKRLIDQIFFAIRIKKRLLIEKERPDLIIASMPTAELTYVVAKFAKKHNVKFIVDVRDMWPNVLINSKNNFFIKLLLNFIFIYMRLLNYYSLKISDSIVSITQEFLNWSQDQTSKKRSTKFDRFFYLSLSDNEKVNLKKNLNEKKIIICFYGIISFKKFDFETLINFCEKNKDNLNYKFYIYGAGDDEEKVKRFANQSKLLDFLGYAKQNDISNISALSDYGLANYKPSFDFRRSIPNKVIEYLSYDLDVISCLEGSTNTFLNKNNIGKIYDYNNLETFEKIIFSLKKNQKTMKYKKIFNENFSVEKVYHEYQNHLEKILK